MLLFYYTEKYKEFSALPFLESTIRRIDANHSSSPLTTSTTAEPAETTTTTTETRLYVTIEESTTEGQGEKSEEQSLGPVHVTGVSNQNPTSGVSRGILHGKGG